MHMVSVISIRSFLRSQLLHKSPGWLLLAGVAFAASASGPLGFACAPAAPGEKVVVHLRILGTYLLRDGTEAQTSMQSSADSTLGIGESGALYAAVLGMNTNGQPNPSYLCTSNVGNVQKGAEEKSRAQLLEQSAPAHLWWAEVRPLPAKMGQ